MWHRIVRQLPRRYYSSSTKEINANSKPSGWDEAKPYSSIPGPKPAPIIGNTWRFFWGELRHDFLTQGKICYEKYGEIVALTKLGIKDMVVIYNTNDIEKLFRSEPPRPFRDGFHSLTYYRNVVRKDIFRDCGNLLGSQGETWYKFRTTVNPVLMQPKTVVQYTSSMDEVADDFIKRMRAMARESPNQEMPANFDHEINKWSFESIGVIALDRRLGCLEDKPNAEVQTMINYMVELFKMTRDLDFNPLGKYYRKFNFPIWKRYVEYQDFFTNKTLEYIEEAEERIKKDINYANKPENEKSAFEKLLKKDKTIAMVMTLDMLSAGIDTTGKTLSAILYFLAKNTQAQDALRKELNSLLPKPDTPISKEILENAPYLKAVIKESQRLSPIAVGILREITNDMVLGGYQIPSGVVVVVPNLYLSLYGKHYLRAKEFMPERWLKTNEGETSHKNAHPFVTMPFGFGARSCIGKRLAVLELEVVVAKIIRNFSLEWPHKDMTFGQTFIYGTQDPLKIRVKEIKE